MKRSDVAGVVIGRFEIDALHAGHVETIQFAANRHNRFIIMIGERIIQRNEKHPLNFEMRRLMVQSAFPEAEIVEVRDQGDHVKWSRLVDSILAALGEEGAILYGSRDSFITSYVGTHQCVEVPEVPFISATQVRQKILDNGPVDSVDFRRGVIYAGMDKFPQGHPCIDIAILRLMHSKRNGGGNGFHVLLGKREPTDELWRFPGGIFDSLLDASFEDTAKRESFEETNLANLKGLVCLGSKVIGDWRYRDSKDRIVSTFFVCKHQRGVARAGDDLKVVGWHYVPNLLTLIKPEHQPLARMLMKYLGVEPASK